MVKEHGLFSEQGTFGLMQMACFKRYEHKVKAKKYILEVMLYMGWEFPKEYGSIHEAYEKFIHALKNSEYRDLL